jgi:hypothetical protein
VALVVGFIFRPRILVTGTLPERVIAGEAAHLTYTIGTSAAAAYHLRVRFRAAQRLENTEAAVAGQLGRARPPTCGRHPGTRAAVIASGPGLRISFPPTCFTSAGRDDEKV